jgi:hypothetical protein
MFQIASVYGVSRKHNKNYIFNENNIDNTQTILHSKNNSLELKIFREPFHQIGKIHNLVFTENTLFYGYYQNYHNWDGLEMYRIILDYSGYFFDNFNIIIF